ncbi:hypothetical protein EON71_00640, partial [bacterium]
MSDNEVPSDNVLEDEHSNDVIETEEDNVTSDHENVTCENKKRKKHAINSKRKKDGDIKLDKLKKSKKEDKGTTINIVCVKTYAEKKNSFEEIIEVRRKVNGRLQKIKKEIRGWLPAYSIGIEWNVELSEVTDFNKIANIVRINDFKILHDNIDYSWFEKILGNIHTSDFQMIQRSLQKPIENQDQLERINIRLLNEKLDGHFFPHLWYYISTMKGQNGNRLYNPHHLQKDKHNIMEWINTIYKEGLISAFVYRKIPVDITLITLKSILGIIKNDKRYTKIIKSKYNLDDQTIQENLNQMEVNDLYLIIECVEKLRKNESECSYIMSLPFEFPENILEYIYKYKIMDRLDANNWILHDTKAKIQTLYDFIIPHSYRTDEDNQNNMEIEKLLTYNRGIIASHCYNTNDILRQIQLTTFQDNNSVFLCPSHQTSISFGIETAYTDTHNDLNDIRDGAYDVLVICYAEFFDVHLLYKVLGPALSHINRVKFDKIFIQGNVDSFNLHSSTNFFIELLSHRKTTIPIFHSTTYNYTNDFCDILYRQILQFHEKNTNILSDNANIVIMDPSDFSFIYNEYSNRKQDSLFLCDNTKILDHLESIVRINSHSFFVGDKVSIDDVADTDIIFKVHTTHTPTSNRSIPPTGMTTIPSIQICSLLDPSNAITLKKGVNVSHKKCCGHDIKGKLLPINHVLKWKNIELIQNSMSFSSHMVIIYVDKNTTKNVLLRAFQLSTQKVMIIAKNSDLDHILSSSSISHEQPQKIFELLRNSHTPHNPPSSFDV